MKWLKLIRGWEWVLLAIGIIGFGVMVWINELYVVVNGGEGLLDVIGGIL